MQERSDARTKCITNTSEKKMVNVSVCCWCHLNISRINKTNTDFTDFPVLIREIHVKQKNLPYWKVLLNMFNNYFIISCKGFNCSESRFDSFKIEIIFMIDVGFISFPKTRTTANPFSFYWHTPRTHWCVHHRQQNLLKHHLSLTQLHQLLIFFVLEKMAFTLLRSASNCAWFLSFRLKAKMFILSKECNALAWSAVNFEASTFKILGETSTAIKSLFSEFSTKYFWSEGSELQPTKSSKASTAYIEMDFISIYLGPLEPFVAFFKSSPPGNRILSVKTEI